MANTLFFEGNAFFEKKMYDAAINKYTEVEPNIRRNNYDFEQLKYLASSGAQN